MKIFYLFLFLVHTISTTAQVTISGSVRDKQGDPVPGVNIYIENSYDGTSSDPQGVFSFQTSEEGKQILVASMVGYQKWKGPINLSSPREIEIVLRESVNTLDAVIITAGTFAAGDKKRAAVLEPLDIYTTASANGDVMAAMRTMPGTQASADDGRLLVRGGDAYEAKTYIDGLPASSPYYSKTPDVPTRGRFSPSLFSGVQFSSGGYSAEYGQALSSVLTLNSTDVASADQTGFSAMSIGAEANITKAFPKSSLMASAGYTNMALYDAVFHSNLDWTKPVESVSFTSTFKYRPASGSNLKAMIKANHGKLGYQTVEGDGMPFSLTNKDDNIYSNINYRFGWNEKTFYQVGIASTYDSERTGYNQTRLNTKKLSMEGRFTITHHFKEGFLLKLGASETFEHYDQEISDAGEEPYFSPTLHDHTPAVFTEAEIKFNKYMAVRPGVRFEYNSILNRSSLAPRIAFALKTGQSSQISAAWGRYYQTPETDYLKFNRDLDFENAIHYILGYQSGDVSTRLFRTEMYYKSYHKLVTWEGYNQYYPQHIKNSGNGYARGIDFFWRDKKSFPRLEYWLTYSWIDTKRLYQNFPEKARPDFISDHTCSMVAKYWVGRISTQFGTSFTLASPRNYDDPSTSAFMDKETGWYNNLSLNMSRLFYLGDQYSVFYVSVSNILGFDQVLSYRTSAVPDAAGDYSLTPVKQDMKRFLFMGLFLTF